MERYQRHFVSQRIGKATGAVLIDGDGMGVVEITARGGPARMRFSFTLSGAQGEHPPSPALAEILLRTAIGQVHKDMLKPPLAATGERRLSNACAPWIGDLEVKPYP